MPIRVIEWVITRTFSAVFLCVFASCTADNGQMTGADVEYPPPGDSGDLAWLQDSSKDEGAQNFDAGSEVPDARDPRGPWNPTLWETGTICTPVSREQSLGTQEFQLPKNSRPYSDVVTRDEYIEEGSPGRYSYSIRPRESHHPNPPLPHLIYGTPGQDVVLSLYVQHGRELENLPDTRLSVVLMVDYGPTRVRYQRMTPDRDGIRDEVEDTGWAFNVSSDVEIIDFTIPASKFSQARAYDIGISFESTYPGGFKWGGSRRFTLLYGSYSRTSEFCARPRKGSDDLPWEYWTARRHMTEDLIAIMHPELPATDDNPEERPIRAPGDVVRLYWSLFRQHHVDTRYVVSVPLLNGRPIGEAIWSTTGTASREYLGSSGTVDDRGYFDVTLPDQPGLHHVMMATWEDPFVPAETLDGELIEGVEWGAGALHENSSVAEFVVE